MIFFDDHHIFYSSWAFVSQLRLSSKELGNCLQTPTLIGCKFLRISNLLFTACLFALLWSAKPWIMTHFLVRRQTWRTFLAFFNAALSAKKNTPPHDGVFCCNSLTMSYFHTGIRTIIGADSFHCPVRDGKEWYQVAMVVRHNLLSPRLEVWATNL